MTVLDIDTRKIEDIIRHVSATEVMPRFNNLAEGDIREKNPGDFVTIADEASEKALAALLSEALPGSLVVGEEAVSKDPSVLKKFSEGKPVWVIDPIDGTYNYSHNRSKFGILVALVANGDVEYGFAFDAPGNRMAVAQRGAGAFIDGRRLKVNADKEKMSDIVCQGGGAQAWHFESVTPMLSKMVNLRCSLHDFMNFYTGEADAVVHVGKVTPWDHAANVLLAREAGGFVCVNDQGAYDPAAFGPAFLMATTSKDAWQMLYPVLHEKLKRK